MKFTFVNAKIQNKINTNKLKMIIMKNSNNHSLDSFISYLEFMNFKQFQTFFSVQINNVTKESHASYAAIISAGIPERFIVAYKYKHMNEPLIECTMRPYDDFKDIVNHLLEF